MPTLPSANSFSIDSFKNTIMQQGGLARPFFFKLLIYPASDCPQKLWDMFNSYGWAFLCRSATLPAAIVQPIELKYFTRSIKIAGAREVQPVTVTFFNTTDYKLHSIGKN
jgi:hypothetical protein